MIERTTAQQVIVHVPALLQLEAFAALGQLAHSVPQKTEVIAFADVESTGLDEDDQREMAFRLLDAVLQPYGEWSTEFKLSEYSSVLHRGLHDIWYRKKARDLRRELGSRVLDVSGILPLRSGGARHNVGRDRFLALYAEALKIVGTVRAYGIPTDLGSALLELLACDPRIGHLEVERARRSLAGSMAHRLEIRLRFPFLKFSEAQCLTEPRSRLSDEALARKMIMDRLPRFDSHKHDSTFQNLLSEYR